MSDTPRTDAAARVGFIEQDMLRSVFVVPLKVAEELEREVADLKSRLDTAWGDVGAMQKVIDRLTAERDDARLLFCMNHPLVVSGDNEARAVASRHGWDCFKEVQP
jgi:hypothetical protein